MICANKVANETKIIDTTKIIDYYKQLTKIILESGKLKGSLAKKHCYK
jgi:hypothetical protein